MAFLSLTLSLSASTPPTLSSLRPLTSSSSSSSKKLSFLPPFTACDINRARSSKRGCRRSLIVGMSPDEEKITRRSPLDFPIEWERPKPGRRPDIFPQFSPMKTPLPPPMPADPPEEEEEEEEKKEEEEEDPEKQDPDEPAQ